MSVMSRDVYPQLATLFGGYMHQDWDTEGKDWPDLVSNFVRDSASDAESAATEIDQLLLDHIDDAALSDEVFCELHCYFDPRPDLGGPTLRDWLREVATLLRELAEGA
jgi:hypothetical protein